MGNSDSTNTIRLKCPQCSKSIRVPISMRGRSGKCPGCGTAIKIPIPKPTKNPAELSPPIQSPPPVAPVQQPAIVQSNPVAPHTTNVYTPVGQPAAVQVNVQNSNVSNSLGIASLILGILSFLICWIPFIGFGLSGLGLLLGIGGLVMALTRRGTGIGYAIAGTAVSALGVLMGVIFLVVLQGMATGLEEVANQMEQEMNKQQSQATPVIDDGDNVAAGGGDANNNPTVDESTDSPQPPKVEFHDAKSPLQLGNVKLQITRVEIGKVPLHRTIMGDDTESKDDLLMIWLEITNTTTNKKIDYQGWMSTYASLSDINAVLTDNNDNRYRGISFSATSVVKDAKTNESIYPGKSIADAVVFELPIDGAEYLDLKLSAKGCKEDGEFKFRIPIEMVKR